MLETFKKMWDLSPDRRGIMKKAMLFTFLRCGFAVTEILAILSAIQVLLGELSIPAGLWRIGILTVLCVLGSFATSYVEQTAAMETGFLMTADKRVSLGRILRNMPLGVFNDVSSGRLAATLTSTMQAVESGGVFSLINVVSGLFNAVAFLAFMLFYDWRIGLIMALGMISYLAVVNHQMSVSRKNAPRLVAAQNRLSESVLTFLQGISITKAFGLGKGDENLDRAVEESCSANIELTNHSMPSQYAAHLTIGIFESAILLVSVGLWLYGYIPVQQAVLLLIFSFMAYGALNQAGSTLSMIGLLSSSLDEVSEVEKMDRIERKMPPEDAKGTEIEFRDVSFSYGSREVLHHISTTIEPKSLTAVIGPSGSGKTTLLQLIPRFRDLTGGQILLGGADIAHMDPEELMQQFSMVFQKVYLFEDTILNNIRFGRPEATLDEVREAARAAQCDEFIMALPEGYETMIQEGGSSLSGGEKQRISIARAILKNAPIVLLDEATSALDAENEAEILKAINALTQDKTVIMIAHRIATVRKADHIIALQDGEIVQEGTHKELSEEAGLYADFLSARAQASGWKLNN